LSGREKRFKADCIHTLTAELARDESVSCYVLEDLTGLINPNTPDNLERGSQKTWRSKKNNTWLHQWAPYLFERFLTYKCEACGIEVVKVSPEYTSQRCSKCGTIESSSRMKNHYHCSVCGHTEHADINAAKNIRDRYLLSLEGKTGRFQPSERVVV